jgi:hypothetical protein
MWPSRRLGVALTEPSPNNLREYRTARSTTLNSAFSAMVACPGNASNMLALVGAAGGHPWGHVLGLTGSQAPLVVIELIQRSREAHALDPNVLACWRRDSEILWAHRENQRSCLHGHSAPQERVLVTRIGTSRSFGVDSTYVGSVTRSTAKMPPPTSNATANATIATT